MNTSLPPDPRSPQAFLAKSPLPLQFAGLLLLTVLTAWGFSPHRHLHAVAWTHLPQDMKEAWGGSPVRLVRWATQADARKHLDSLEGARHYLDLDDLDILFTSHGMPAVWGMPWGTYKQSIFEIDSLTSPRTHGVLPWQLEWSYRRLVKAMASNDSTTCELDKVIRAAADLGHYLADAHVPLHTSGNYDGQRSGQGGIHALWETQAVEAQLHTRTCPCLHLTSFEAVEGMPYDPVWTPWDILKDSHALVEDVFQAEKEWQNMVANNGWRMRTRGRTLAMLPSLQALAAWDSLTNGHTWPRFCTTADHIAKAWHAAWMEAGQPHMAASTEKDIGLPPWLLYLQRRWKRGKVAGPDLQHKSNHATSSLHLDP